jgi:hypothetical protein
MLQPRNVIPIPDADEAKSHTCFYRAKVIATPTKVSDNENWRLNVNVLYLE